MMIIKKTIEINNLRIILYVYEVNYNKISQKLIYINSLFF